MKKLKGIVFKGTNLWILIFTIIVASSGTEYELNSCNNRSNAYLATYGTDQRNGL